MQRKIYVIFLILLIIATLICISFFTGNKVINNIYTSFTNKTGETSEGLVVSHVVYDNQDEESVKVLFKASSTNGLEYVIRPDGTKINANGKNEINLDYATALDTENTFKIKEVGKAEIENKQTMTKDFIDNQFKLTEDVENNEYKVEYAKKMSSDKTYKKIGVDYSENPWVENDDNPWIEYKNDTITIENLSDLDTVNTVNGEDNISTGTAKIQLMKKDTQGNVVHTYNPKICNFKTNSDFELFDYIRHTGTIASDYFTYDFPKNIAEIEKYSVKYSLEKGKFSVGYADLDMSKLPYNKASSVNISFKLHGTPAYPPPGTSTACAAEIYYVGDSTTIKKQTSRYGGWGDSNQVLTFELDPNKTLDHINFTFEPWPHVSGAYGIVNKIVFNNVTN